MPNIVRNRIARAIKCTPAGDYQRSRCDDRQRRGSYKNGVIAYQEALLVRITTQQLERIERICKALKIGRSIFVREAIEMYLSFAETEFAEGNELPDIAPIKRRPRKRKPSTE